MFVFRRSVVTSGYRLILGTCIITCANRRRTRQKERALCETCLLCSPFCFPLLGRPAIQESLYLERGSRGHESGKHLLLFLFVDTTTAPRRGIGCKGGKRAREEARRCDVTLFHRLRQPGEVSYFDGLVPRHTICIETPLLPGTHDSCAAAEAHQLRASHLPPGRVSLASKSSLI